MPWNPEVYDKFREKRREPFYDLISHIQPGQDMRILDLGCGTGQLTRVLADKFEAAQVLGIDTSAEMLAKAPKQENISFAARSIEQQLELNEKWDLIVANASLQWLGDHQTLFPRIIRKLLPGGQLAVQMPSQNENRLNQILYELAQESPFYDALKNTIRHPSLLTLDDYTQLLYAHGVKQAVIYQKVYPIIAQSVDTLYDFISGSALVPYMEKLDEPMASDFTAAFKARIALHFSTSPIVYAFKRLILVGRF